MFPARILLWSGSAVTGTALFGADFLVQVVEVPLWAVLVLTFVPTLELIAWVRAWVEARQTEKLDVEGLEDLISEREKEDDDD